MRNHTVVVCGYGCDLHPAYMRYLMYVARYVNTHGEVRLVIVSGGTTQQGRFPNTSEAAVMRQYLETVGEVRIRIVEDHDAFTSYTNMFWAREILYRCHTQLEGNEDELIIFCDAIRALKVKVIAERIFKKHPIRIEAYDLAPRGSATSQLLSTIIDVLAAYVPLVNSLKEGVRQILARRR